MAFIVKLDAERTGQSSGSGKIKYYRKILLGWRMGYLWNFLVRNIWRCPFGISSCLTFIETLGHVMEFALKRLVNEG